MKKFGISLPLIREICNRRLSENPKDIKRYEELAKQRDFAKTIYILCKNYDNLKRIIENKEL